MKIKRAWTMGADAGKRKALSINDRTELFGASVELLFKDIQNLLKDEDTEIAKLSDQN
jgi:hypothetical protein